MSTRGRWITGLLALALALGALVVRALHRGPERGSAPESTPAGAREPSRERPSVASSGGGARSEPLREAEGASPEARPLPPEAVAAPTAVRSPLAHDLEDVAASFVTELPRVTDLLDLVEHLASLAVVDEQGMTVERAPDGRVTSARGALSIGDLRGSFQIDPDGYLVEFHAELGGGPWSTRAIQIAFQEGASGARGCHATVQFNPAHGVEPSPLGELLLGWSVGTGERGTLARPLTTTLVGDTWQIGSSEAGAQEFPWATSYAGGFDAWLRLLRPYADPAR